MNSPAEATMRGKFCSILLLLAFFVNDVPAAPRQERDQRISSILFKHSSAFVKAQTVIANGAVQAVLEVSFIPPSKKEPWDGRNARETTIVPSSLSMENAIIRAVGLYMPAADKSVDPVLSGVVKHVSVLCDKVVGYRADMRQCMRSASRLLAEANKDLQGLVPEFAKPIAGHVNFAFIEAVLRVTKWPYEYLIDNCIFGFEPVGDICPTGIHRPIVEHTQDPISPQED